MPRRRLAAATGEQLDRLVRPLLAAKLFPDEEALRAAHAERPWAIQVSAQGDVAVLDRWRDHLPLLAIEALWCPFRAIPEMARELARIACAQGFTGLVSPPVLETDISAYRAGGFEVREMLLTLDVALDKARIERSDQRSDQSGVAVRRARARDLDDVVELDARCFEPFWAYDRRLLTRFLKQGGVSIAERDGRCVGYTLCTVDRDSAVLGRLCVEAPARRAGIGRRLLSAAIVEAREAGARSMTLSTQTGNLGALLLYRSVGFQPTARRYAFLTLGLAAEGSAGDSIGQIMDR